MAKADISESWEDCPGVVDKNGIILAGCDDGWEVSIKTGKIRKGRHGGQYSCMACGGRGIR